MKAIEEKYLPFHLGEKPWIDEEEIVDYNLKIPPWFCQPYIRIPPEEHKQKLEEHQKWLDDPNRIKRQFFDNEGNEISRKKMKKMRRRERRPQKGEKSDRHDELCSKEDCANTRGLKCEYILCKSCCRDKCYSTNLDCKGHKIFIKSRREKAIYFEKLDKLNGEQENNESSLNQNE